MCAVEDSLDTTVETSLTLPYEPPYDWQLLLSFFHAHHLPGVESVDQRGYERVVYTSLGLGCLRVTQLASRNSLRVSIWNGDMQDLQDIRTTVRRMFDLDAKPDVLRIAMSADARLSGIWNRYPGLRVCRSWNGFEALFTTLLGQLVSVSFGRVLTAELMKTAGTAVKHPKTSQEIHLFPTARQILNADLSMIRTSVARRTALLALARLVEDKTLDCAKPIPARVLRKILLAVPGVGSWTSEYIALRGFNDDDAFPATDYVLKRELRRFPDVDVERVRPWRAYAAVALWKNFFEDKRALDGTIE